MHVEPSNRTTQKYNNMSLEQHYMILEVHIYYEAYEVENITVPVQMNESLCMSVIWLLGQLGLHQRK
jgi:hypothetical protein